MAQGIEVDLIFATMILLSVSVQPVMAADAINKALQSDESHNVGYFNWGIFADSLIARLGATPGGASVGSSVGHSVGKSLEGQSGGMFAGGYKDLGKSKY
jgi:hypothetical protein